MKKFQLFLMAALITAAASAFTTQPTTLGSYFKDGESIVPITTDGFCDAGVNFCTYTLIPGRDDNGDPANYEGVGTEDKQWVPLP